MVNNNIQKTNKTSSIPLWDFPGQMNQTPKLNKWDILPLRVLVICTIAFLCFVHINRNIVYVTQAPLPNALRAVSLKEQFLKYHILSAVCIKWRGFLFHLCTTPPILLSPSCVAMMDYILKYAWCNNILINCVLGREGTDYCQRA